MEQGTVIKIEKEYAYIYMKKKSACKSCAGKGICFAGDKPLPLRVKNEKKFQIGDIVEVELRSKSRLLSAFLLFILPLMFMSLGYVFFFQISNSEGIGILGSFVGLVICIFILKIINQKVSQSDFFQPLSVIKKI